MSSFSSAHYCLFALLLFVGATGCNEKKHSGSATPLRIFYSDLALQEAEGQIFGAYIWPSEISYGKYELGALADPLISNPPSWGSYEGISQSMVNDNDIEVNLEVTLTSPHSVQKFEEFCQTLGFDGGVILIYLEKEGVFSPRLEEVLKKFAEPQEVEQAVPPKSDRAGG